MGSTSGWWSDLGTLRSISTWFQWASIGLVFVSGFLQVGKYFVDRRERALAAAVQAERENPAARPIQTASATVELVVESRDDVNTTYMDRGGYIGFARGTEALMLLAATQSRARQTGGGEVVWDGVFSMDARDAAVGKPVRSLVETEYLQIGFSRLAPKSKVKSGSVIVTINSAVRLEVPVPAQEMTDDKILVRELSVHLGQLRQ